MMILPAESRCHTVPQIANGSPVLVLICKPLHPLCKTYDFTSGGSFTLCSFFEKLKSTVQFRSFVRTGVTPSVTSIPLLMTEPALMVCDVKPVDCGTNRLMIWSFVSEL